MAKRKLQKQQRVSQRRQAEVQAAAERSAGLVALLAALAGIVLLVLIFMPWYTDKHSLVKGSELLFSFDQTPKRLRSAFAEVGSGRWLIVATLLYAMAGIGIGLGWQPLTAKLGRWLDETLVVVVVMGLALAVVLLLAQLEMNVRSSMLFGIRATAVLLAVEAGIFLMLLAGRDRMAAREDAALSLSDWGIWLGGMLLLGLFHYLILSRQIILRAPEAVQQLRGRQFP